MGVPYRRLHVQKFDYPSRDGHRSEFFLHGGDTLGSAGCIDVGNQDVELFSLIKKTNTNDGTDNILVIVTEQPNSWDWNYMDTGGIPYTVEEWEDYSKKTRG